MIFLPSVYSIILIQQNQLSIIRYCGVQKSQGQYIVWLQAKSTQLYLLYLKMQFQIKELLQTSQTLGVLKYVNEKEITNFKLAYQPYYSTKATYDVLGQLELIWQKLFFSLSQDQEFLEKVFKVIVERDEMIKRFFSIFKKLREQKKNDGIAFSRCDYYFNLNDEPKLTEYNLMSVGMQSHMQKYQQAKKLTDYENRQYYADCSTVIKFAETIEFYSRRKDLKGVILFVVQKVQSNLFDQKRFQIELIKKGFKTKRATYEELHKNISKAPYGDLYFKTQLVSIVYYRSGYKLNQFTIQGDMELGWKIKEDIQLSNAISIPSVAFELINQKRVQTELKKKGILRKYLSQEETLKIQSTFVNEWEFQSMTNEEFENIVKEVEKNPEKYILKPNLEGGNNNFFGVKALEKLKSMKKEEAQLFILMEKIISKSQPNKIINGLVYDEIKCLYEISRYGGFCWIDGKLQRNFNAGFLIRAKPQYQNEGGIMTGVGAIVPWKFVQ